MTPPVFHPKGPDSFSSCKPPIETEDDFAQAVLDVAHEMDARRTWRERVQDAVWTGSLFFAISWRHFRGW